MNICIIIVLVIYLSENSKMNDSSLLSFTKSKEQSFMADCYPLIPSVRAKKVVLSYKAKKAAASLEKQGVSVFLLSDNPSLPTNIASHADLNCLYLGCNRFAVLKEQTKLVSELKTLGYYVYEVAGAWQKYPCDCKLNCYITKNCCVSHETALNDEISGFLFNRGVRRIKAKQGYSRCSVAAVSESAAITADNGISTLLEGQGIVILRVPAGEIALSGYDSGFIGGSCFLIDRNELAFFGRVSELSYYSEIKAFCDKYEIKITELSDEPLTDYGGAVIIK